MVEPVITNKGQCRPLIEFKDFDWKNATLDDRVEFCLADVGEAGMDCNELRAMARAMETLAPQPIVYVETGLGWGFSTRMALTYILKYGGELYSIDIKARDAIVRPLTELELWNKVNFIQSDSRTVNWPQDKLIDYLNIDSEHAISFALGEYMRFRMLLHNHASIIGFHDTDCCWGVQRALEIIEEIDALEPVADATNLLGAGYKSFHIIQRDRNDKEWNTRKRLGEEVLL